MLSAVTHGHKATLAPALFEAVVTSVRGLDTRRATLYLDLALSSFSEEVRSALEAQMRNGTYEYQTQIAREFVAQGVEKGRLEGERKALLQVLEARGLKVEGVARRRLTTCTEQAQLERWLHLAVKVESVQQLFQDEPDPRSVARTRTPPLKARRPRVRR